MKSTRRIPKRKWAQNHKYAHDRSKGWARFKSLNKTPRKFRRGYRRPQRRNGFRSVAFQLADLEVSYLELVLEALEAHTIFHGDRYDEDRFWREDWEEHFPTFSSFTLASLMLQERLFP